MEVYLSDGSVWTVSFADGNRIIEFLNSGLKRAVSVTLSAPKKKTFKGWLSLANVIGVGAFDSTTK